MHMAVDNRDTHTKVVTTLHDYILDSFLLDTAYLSDEASLVESGIVDSTGMMELVAFVEERFGIEVDDRDLTPEHFDSVSRLAFYVMQRHPRF